MGEPLHAKLLGTFRRWILDPRFQRRIALFVVLALSAALVVRGLREGRVQEGGRSNDFSAYHAAARAVLSGDLGPAYQATPRPYQYPPTLAVLIAPLGLLPLEAAAVLWTLGNLAILIFSLRALKEALGPPTAPLDAVFALALSYRMFESDFAQGNANTLVLGLIVWGFLVLRRGKSLLGGAILGIAAAVKVTPLFLLVWMILRRRWDGAAGGIAGLVLAAVVLPALVLGPGPWVRSMEAFYGSTLRPLDVTGDGYRGEAPGGYLPGQSIRALLHRLLRATDATAHDEAMVMVNIVDLPKGAVDLAWMACAALVVGGLLWRFRSSGPHWSGPEIGALLAAMVLLAPLSRKAHFVVLLPAAAAGFSAIRLACGRRRRLGLWLWWGAFALVAFTAPGFLGRSLSTWLLAFCPFGLAALCLAILCAAAGFSRPSPGIGPGCRRSAG